jgi:hypothetical protein
VSSASGQQRACRQRSPAPADRRGITPVRPCCASERSPRTGRRRGTSHRGLRVRRLPYPCGRPPIPIHARVWSAAVFPSVSAPGTRTSARGAPEEHVPAWRRHVCTGRGVGLEHGVRCQARFEIHGCRSTTGAWTTNPEKQSSGSTPRRHAGHRPKLRRASEHSAPNPNGPSPGDYSTPAARIPGGNVSAVPNNSDPPRARRIPAGAKANDRSPRRTQRSFEISEQANRHPINIRERLGAAPQDGSNDKARGASASVRVSERASESDWLAGLGDRGGAWVAGGRGVSGRSRSGCLPAGCGQWLLAGLLWLCARDYAACHAAVQGAQPFRRTSISLPFFNKGCLDYFPPVF